MTGARRLYSNSYKLLFGGSSFNYFLYDYSGVTGNGVNYFLNSANSLNCYGVNGFFGGFSSLVVASGESNCSNDGSSGYERLFHDFFGIFGLF